MQDVKINSEIGTLEDVIIHTPGLEVEKMTPKNAERALYSDILNLSVAREEYLQFKGILQKYCKTFEVKNLLDDIFNVPGVKEKLLETICSTEGVPELKHDLFSLNNMEAARQLVEGVEIKRNNLTRYLSNERYSLRPLHNFLFTRDASISMYDKVLIGKMASEVRSRESVIMEAIFKYHPEFQAEILNAKDNAPPDILAQIKIEGGDVMIARDDVLVVGTGSRTSTQGIDYIIETIKAHKTGTYHIIVQELPETPESFIHLDMVFTFIDRDACMVYEPLILKHSRFRTIHIIIDNGKVKSINNEPGLLTAMKKTGFNLTPIKCGGEDTWHQEREQWHSGANFLSVAPGVVIGYERNVYTIEALNKKGFDIIKSTEILEHNLPIPKKKTVITIAGAELARGGGGARCMSMPVRRKDVEW